METTAEGNATRVCLVDTVILWFPYNAGDFPHPLAQLFGTYKPDGFRLTSRHERSELLLLPGLLIRLSRCWSVVPVRADLLRLEWPVGRGPLA